MASYAAISVVANTIRGLLLNSVPTGEVAGIEVKMMRTQDFQDPEARPNLGISIYLHRLEFNTNRRNQPPRTNSRGERFRPPVALDLHFLITAWGPTAERQMDLLGWAVRTLQDNPQLPSGLLNRFTGDRPGAVFESEEAFDLLGENLSAQDFDSLWGNTLPNQQPSVSYVVRQVLLDSQIAMPDVEPVQTHEFGYAKFEKGPLLPGN